MRTTARLAGATAAAVSMMALAGPAFADSANNEGVNVLNDNNASVLPIQACGNDVAALGAVVEVLNAEQTKCTNAPVVDHPSSHS